VKRRSWAAGAVGGIGRGGSKPYVFANAEAEAWVAAFTATLNNDDKYNYDSFAGALKAGSLWSAIDAHWWMGGIDSQASRINGKNPGSLTLSLVNSPAHAPYRGFTGDGATSYLRTGYNPSTFGGQWTLNSAGLVVYSRTAGQTFSTEMGCRVSGSDNQSLINLRSTSDTAAIRLNQDVNTGLFPANTDGSGLFIGRRTANNAIEIFRNNVSLGSGTQVSQAIPNLEMYIGALNENGSAVQFSSRQLLYAAAMGGPTNQMVADLTGAVAAFATAIGANV
jgi:hypothetical protein